VQVVHAAPSVNKTEAADDTPTTTGIFAVVRFLWLKTNPSSFCDHSYRPSQFLQERDCSYDVPEPNVATSLEPWGSWWCWRRRGRRRGSAESIATLGPVWRVQSHHRQRQWRPGRTPTEGLHSTRLPTRGRHQVHDRLPRGVGRKD